MRWLRANSILMLTAATVATFMAALTLQSSPLHLAASVAVAVVVVVLTRWAIREIRAWGARPIGIVAALALAGLALAMQVIPLVVEMGWIRAALIVAAWGGLLLAAAEPRIFVRLSGGPRAEWSLLRERAALWNDVRGLSEEEIAAAGATIETRVRGLERYRTSHTAAYIDTFERLTLGDEPDEVKGRLAADFGTMETDLLRSLAVTPAWEAEFDVDPSRASG